MIESTTQRALLRSFGASARGLCTSSVQNVPYATELP
jgi:hypothetical protein